LDGTSTGGRAGPALMIPHIKNVAAPPRPTSAIDAIAAKLMGFESAGRTSSSCASPTSGAWAVAIRARSRSSATSTPPRRWHFDGPLRTSPSRPQPAPQSTGAPLKRPMGVVAQDVARARGPTWPRRLPRPVWYPGLRPRGAAATCGERLGRLFANWGQGAPDAEGALSRRGRGQPGALPPRGSRPVRGLRLLGMAVVRVAEMKARRSAHDCPGC